MPRQVNVLFALSFIYQMKHILSFLRIHGISQSPRYFFVLPRDKKSPTHSSLGHGESCLQPAKMNVNSISWIYAINFPPTITYDDLLSSGVPSNSANCRSRFLVTLRHKTWHSFLCCFLASNSLSHTSVTWHPHVKYGARSNNWRRANFRADRSRPRP